MSRLKQESFMSWPTPTTWANSCRNSTSTQPSVTLPPTSTTSTTHLANPFTIRFNITASTSRTRTTLFVWPSSTLPPVETGSNPNCERSLDSRCGNPEDDTRSPSLRSIITTPPPTSMTSHNPAVGDSDPADQTDFTPLPTTATHSQLTPNPVNEFVGSPSTTTPVPSPGDGSQRDIMLVAFLVTGALIIALVALFVWKRRELSARPDEEKAVRQRAIREQWRRDRAASQRINLQPSSRVPSVGGAGADKWSFGFDAREVQGRDRSDRVAPAQGSAEAETQLPQRTHSRGSCSRRPLQLSWSLGE
ncbi:hypothetical protein M011DRAFT_462524 [Sporormia fimetaria CBS 119925]|uniref:Transmembrane protein n=1 Tax=Sporormia fimetaria CBS 119925 TaxID=1340428 RepID=A0A6A6UVJ5_9PLEO|nr:hypothetical protein M011DRAFT_462524 [Sporormia fimetaria CBS 119925]